MINITKEDVICLLNEIETIETSLENKTGFNSYDYFLTEVLMMDNGQLFKLLNTDYNGDNQRKCIEQLVNFISEYFNLPYYYVSKSERT